MANETVFSRPQMNREQMQNAHRVMCPQCQKEYALCLCDADAKDGPHYGRVCPPCNKANYFARQDDLHSVRR